MELTAVVQSQYHASLSMLEQAVQRCPESLWTDDSYANPFWQIAFHALFYTHLYLHPSEADFTRWAKHHGEAHRMGESTQAAYTKEELLEYLAVCRQAVDNLTERLDWEGESGFDWLPMGKLELQFYTIRHLHQHTGELCERLTQAAQVDVDWVGMGRRKEG